MSTKNILISRKVKITLILERKKYSPIPLICGRAEHGHNGYFSSLLRFACNKMACRREQQAFASSNTYANLNPPGKDRYFFQIKNLAALDD
jgi:hypothetical protein